MQTEKNQVSNEYRIFLEFHFKEQISGSFNFQNGIFFSENGNPSLCPHTDCGTKHGLQIQGDA